MPAKAIQVSLDPDLLRRIDEDPEVGKKGRSAFIRAAVELYLAAKERRRIDRDIVQAYRRQGNAMLDEIAEHIPDQAWPSDWAAARYGSSIGPDRTRGARC